MYRHRIVDKYIDIISKVYNAINIIGPKGCGKTTTAKQRCKSIIEFQDEEKRDNLLLIASTSPIQLLKNQKPILFDERQDAPKIWGTIRKDCDDNPNDVGSYFLTGSSSNKINTPHSGTLRIATIKMYPMSLFELGHSNGTVSLNELFNDSQSFNGCKSSLKIDDLIEAICIGGWPKTINIKDSKLKLLISKELFKQTYSVDISNIDNTKRNQNLAKTILQSYARNLCTLTESKTIFNDVNANYKVSEATYYSYISALEKLCIIDDIGAWCPSIRSKTSIRSSKKRNFIDPSIATAALGISPEYLHKDFKTLGFLFESLCIRDLKCYSQANNGTVSYYHDRYDLEADAVLHLEDGRYALIEFKLGESEIDKGAKHLCEIERLVNEYNLKNQQTSLKLPSLKIVITGTEYGYKRDDGVLVIPIGCLRD